MGLVFVIRKQSCDRLLYKSFGIQKWQMFSESDRRGVTSYDVDMPPVTASVTPPLILILALTKLISSHLEVQSQPSNTVTAIVGAVTFLVALFSVLLLVQDLLRAFPSRIFA